MISARNEATLIAKEGTQTGNCKQKEDNKDFDLVQYDHGNLTFPRIK